MERKVHSRRFLVKIRDADLTSFAAGLEPKLHDVSLGMRRLRIPSATVPGVGLAEDPGTWLLMAPYDAQEAQLAWKGLSDWDLAHALYDLLEERGRPASVEPDLLQSFPVERPDADRGLPGVAKERCDPGQPVPEAPVGSGFTWHLDASHSELEAARREVGGNAAPVVIAHLDTGYDPDHVVRPQHIDRARQRNFFDAGRLHDATDRKDPESLLESVGHGTGTIGLLAGGPLAGILPADGASRSPLGGAPDATVVPVVVANFVAQFYTSTIAEGLAYAAEIDADVVSMSLGGLPSDAWADAVNACYEKGVVLVAAAGNNFSGIPMRQIVWPARFNRVIAACGAMADGRPYTDLGLGVMEGNYGPTSTMRTALSAYTPNVPWPILGCSNVVSRSGSGTSAATPQIAAAAALWLAKYKRACEVGGVRGWRRVEAVRRALFDSAHGAPRVDERLGRGILRAAAALRRAPQAADSYEMTPRDTASLAVLRALTGLGVEGHARASLLRLEAMHAAARSAAVAKAFPDLESAGTDALPRLAEILLDSEEISRQLRAWLSSAATSGAVRVPLPPPEMPKPRGKENRLTVPARQERTAGACNVVPVPIPPKARRLRIFSSDPLAATALETEPVAVATVTIPWEPARGVELLPPGPVGEYIEVVDVDPPSRRFYPPVDLDDRLLLAQDGLAPDVGNPQFHQQMVYAVAMRTIDVFERALGRVALWAPKPRFWQDEDYKKLAARKDISPEDPRRLMAGFVRRLRIYPHALRAQNAYYSPAKVALLFGYFVGMRTLPDGTREPGDTVFTCLSHDIIAHETTHALLDGLHRRYQEASNPDVRAFHEGFADIVAVFQHFSLPEVLAHEIKRCGGSIGASRLGQLAREFGMARGRSALRDAIGTDPEKVNYLSTAEAHDRGAVLLAAVFDAFIRIYERRTERLKAVAGHGAGGHPGTLHPALVELLARAATKCAEHVLNICIRALDYCPPVDITFSDYLRALITADSDLVPDDEHGYRVAFIEAFRRRYIFPDDVRSTSTASLRWRGPEANIPGLGAFLRQLPLTWSRDTDRLDAYMSARCAARRLHDWILANVGPEAAFTLGIDMGVRNERGEPKFDVHSVRRAERVMPDGRIRRDIIAVVTQSRWEKIDGNTGFKFRSGATIIADADGEADRIRYVIVKSAKPAKRLKQAREFAARAGDTAFSLYFGEPGADDEPFALLHAGHA